MKKYLNGIFLALCFISLSCSEEASNDGTKFEGAIIDGNWKLVRVECNDKVQGLTAGLEANVFSSGFTFSSTSFSRYWDFPSQSCTETVPMSVKFFIGEGYFIGTDIKTVCTPGCVDIDGNATNSTDNDYLKNCIGDPVNATFKYPFELDGDTLKITISKEAIEYSKLGSVCDSGSLDEKSVFIYKKQ